MNNFYDSKIMPIYDINSSIEIPNILPSLNKKQNYIQKYL